MSHRLRFTWISGLLFLTIPLLAGLSLFKANQVMPTPALPTPSPLPAYLGVYPKHGQLVHLSDQPREVGAEETGSGTNLNIGVPWQFGDVCVVLDAAALLKPGQFWTASDVGDLSKLAIDGVSSVTTGSIVDGLLDIQMIANGTVVAETGGPYGMCWHGPTQAGYHQASFAFETLRYDWWYQIGH